MLVELVQRLGQEDGGGGVVQEGSYGELNAVNKTWAERKEAETQQEGPFPHRGALRIDKKV